MAIVDTILFVRFDLNTHMRCIRDFQSADSLTTVVKYSLEDISVQSKVCPCEIRLAPEATQQPIKSFKHQADHSPRDHSAVLCFDQIIDELATR
eukprot:scaffold352668_cov23-Prasinocladus_malaysianus.AAC.1